MSVTSDQAKALFEVGCFILIADLPAGSEVSIDNDAHYTTQKFSGWKMIPPGLHLITWSLPTSSSHNDTPTGGLSLRHGMFRFLIPRQTVVLRYSAEEEGLVPSLVDEYGNEVETTVGKEHLRTMDASLAPYPFAQMEEWKALTSLITPSDLSGVLGRSGKVDGLMEADGDEEARLASIPLASSSTSSSTPAPTPNGQANSADGAHDSDPPADSTPIEPTSEEPTLHFLPLDLKRSWKKGAQGEEVTRFSRDKSWLLMELVLSHLGGEPNRLLSQLQFSFLLFLRVYNFSSLATHKRLLSLLSRSASTLLSGLKSTTSLDPLFPSSNLPLLRKLTDQQRMIDWYTSFLHLLIAQLQALPDDAFTSDLQGTGLEEYWITELDELYRGVASAITITSSPSSWSTADFQPLESAMGRLRDVAGKKYGWDLIDVREYNRLIREQELMEEETGYIEEGEDAPVIVDI